MRSVVWLKRDLRLEDHQPLARAAEGQCLILYVAEGSLRAAEDFDDCHRDFINQSLVDLAPRLAEIGGRLVVAEGEVVEVLDKLLASWPFDRLLSHEETGNLISYARDRAVRSWAEKRGVEWAEYAQHGVFRAQKSRDGWAGRWRKRMDQPLTLAPTRLSSPATKFNFETALPAASEHPLRQSGGETRARLVLEEFLNHRGQEYASQMSSPVTAHDACSRLSAHLAWGNLSMREIFQATESRAAALRESSPRPPHWLKSLAAFSKRLRWHCHFIQKLEDEPAIEYENMQRTCDGLREDSFNQDWFEAWKAGQTGYPMVDACMRALHQQKWINFRMRAMLVSFASYHLWLDWRKTAPWLATQFLDYEPGIHYSQIQMQSGTTGINTLRIYSPAKQVLDQDPEGVFIHRWCPELEGLTGKALANPEIMADDGGIINQGKAGRGYPLPIVEHAVATKAARSRITAIRRTDKARAESREVFEKHGSRKRGGRKQNRSTRQQNSRHRSLISPDASND